MKIRPVNNLIELFQQWTLTINLPIFLCLFRVQRAVCVFFILSLRWSYCRLNAWQKSLMVSSALSAVALSMSAQELDVFAALSRGPRFIFTSWRFVDDVHVEFLLQKRLNFLSRRVVAGNKRLSYLCIIVLVYLWAAGFWRCMCYLLFLWFPSHLLTKHASHLLPQSEKCSSH